MTYKDAFSTETIWQEDSFRFIEPEEFRALGIDPEDIPPGTFPALKHPSQLLSRFGGNAYGFGLVEVHDRLKPKDIKLLQTIHFENPQGIRRYYRKLNDIYRQIGLLIRFSSLGKPYYLIPVHLVSNTLTHIKAKVDEITKIVGFHSRKFFQERHEIGLLAQQDDLIIHELSLLLKEHRLVVIDSLEKLKGLDRTLDLVILTRDLDEIVLMEEFHARSPEPLPKKRLDQYATYILWKLDNLLKKDGEIFIIANRHTPKTNRVTKVVFKTMQEAKNFSLFSHVFKTRKRYRIRKQSLQVNVYDFQQFLSGRYVEQELVAQLLGEKRLEDLTLEQMENLPYLNLPLSDRALFRDQETMWSKHLSIYFDQIFLKPLLPKPVKEDWAKRFSCADYDPNYMLIYLGQKKAPKTSMFELKRDVMESRLSGCPPDFLADYRNSFDYLIRTLRVLERLKRGNYKALPQFLIDRLKQPLENKQRRFHALNDVMKLMTKISRLEKIRDYINPDQIEGPRTKVLENIDALTFFGFTYTELKEIFYIVLGHTPMGRIISGKMNEKSLKPISDLARTYDPQEALNLLRYCRLMSMAEIEASRGSELTSEQLAELFSLYESAVRVVFTRELDWDRLLDEKITSMGGIHYKIIRKLLKMINHFEFLDNWSELSEKGPMEKESLADYDEQKLSRIENVIRLVKTIVEFEEKYLKADPLQLPLFYRKILDIEFHGTGHLFERLDSSLVFLLLWITVNVTRNEIINFNPVLTDLESAETSVRLNKVEQEARWINTRYLELDYLGQFSEQLYQNRSSYVVGTGFQLKVDPDTHSLSISYTDMDRNIKSLESMRNKLAGSRISEIALDDLRGLEILFSNLERFYQSHLRLLSQSDFKLNLPARQKRWFQKTRNIREVLKKNFLKVLFRPEHIYTDLERLYRNTPTLLEFILPEFMILRNLPLSGHLYLKTSVTEYILATTKKFQALMRQDRASFQDIEYLHRLAQMEFGPMATGIVGVSESQMQELESIVKRLSLDPPLLRALVMAFIFQDIGRIPALRSKYDGKYNPADLAQAGGLFLEEEDFIEEYQLSQDTKSYLVFLVKHHGLLHRIVRGEVSFLALKDVLDPAVRNQSLFEAFFVFSFVTISAIREDLILEDLAGWLFQIRNLCREVIKGEKTFDRQLDDVFMDRGNLFFGVEIYHAKGLPEGMASAHYLESKAWEAPERETCIKAGKMIFALERLFRLRGIRYVGFVDLANMMLKVPLKYIHKKRKFSSVGYATFEKEVYEAFRIYNTLQNLAEPARHFILDRLAGDRVRILGYEKVSGYLTYQNQLKVLMLGLLGTERFRPKRDTIWLSFLGLSEKVEKRYEDINDYFNALPLEKIWKNRSKLTPWFSAKTGVVLKKENFPNALSVAFIDRINIEQKISYMQTINNVEQLKNYFHYSLQSLRKHPFQTDDYELQLERSFEKRLGEITSALLEQTKKQMDLINEFEGLHNLVNDLLERSWELGFTEDQKHRLKDLFELRKDSLKNEKLAEINQILDKVQDIHELRDCWEGIKWYLQSNRPFFGKEFETLIARKFDEALHKIPKE